MPNPPALWFFLTTVLAIWGLLCLHTNFKTICSSSEENATGILIGIALNLQIALGNMVILKILIHLIQQHSTSSHLFVSFSISFTNILVFSEYRPFVSLGRFIPSYFFYAMVNGMAPLISLSNNALLVSRSATDFCVLILYPEILLNSLMSSNGFLVPFLRVFTYSMSSAVSFTSSFPV